jgi:hypothetical protein
MNFKNISRDNPNERRVNSILSFLEKEYYLDLEKDSDLRCHLKDLIIDYLKELLSKTKSRRANDNSMVDEESDFMVEVRILLDGYRKLN